MKIKDNKMELTLLQLCLLLKPLTEELYFVGGCVRDMVLGKEPNDIDLVLGQSVHGLFKDNYMEDIEHVLKEQGWSVNSVGKNFLIIFASKNGYQFEIAIFRQDSTTTIDGRHPDSVEVGTITKDSERRDFVFNALYYNPFNGDVLDPTKLGIKAIQDKQIVYCGKASQRIKEDFLRVMRAYRFSSQLGFEIPSKTLRLLRSNFNEAVSTLPPERIRLELEKIVGI